jgi:hypothetical protein
MNPLKQEEVSRLREALIWSRQRLQVFRENRYDALRQYVGANYSEDGANDKVPLNMLELFVTIYQHSLAAKNPAVSITTKYAQLKATAAKLELAVTNLMNEIEIEKTFARAVKDALFSIGIVKVGLCRETTIEYNGRTHDIGRPYADRISLDDWVHDMTAREIGAAQFMGNRYRMDYEEFMDRKDFNAKAKQDMDVGGDDVYDLYNEGGDTKAAAISQGQEAHEDGQFRKEVELWDLWLPRDGLLVTLRADTDHDGRPLKVMEWDGPEKGPYHILSFCEVPDNVMPLAPIANLIDMHTLANSLFRKLGRQAERQKTVLGVQSGAQDDGNRIIDADDGDVLALDNPDRSREYSFGGISQESLAMLLQVRGLFTYLGGNLDALGGLTTQAPTLGQEELLAASSSRRVTEMQKITARWAQEIVRDLTWYAYTDPLWSPQMLMRIANTDIDIPVGLTPEEREADYLDFNFKVEPYSMSMQSPQQKLQSVMQVFQTIILPLAPNMQQQGIGVNFEGLLKTIAKYLNMTELEDILHFAPGVLDLGEGPQGQPSPRSAYSHRVHERVNRPGATMQGNEQVLSNVLLGGNPQQAERNAVSRAPG